jgi:serine/threonine-protein kinase
MPILTEEERLGTLVAGRYRLESILGRGGTGVVFQAVHTWTGRQVAVKLLRPEYARDLSLVRRFLQEARTAAGLEHPNVVQVLDMGAAEDGAVYLVLELLRGESLSDILERTPRLEPGRLLRIVLPVMDALAYAHAQRIVHRDLKPDNVFIRQDATGRSVPTLLDFGMARMVETQWGHATQSGTLVGTPFYMSPEQVNGETDVGPESDVWSMGVLLYRCLTGRLPFEENTPTKLLLAIVQGRPKPVRELAPEVPEPLAEAVDRALRSDRNERFADVAELAREVRSQAARSGIAIEGEPEAVPAGSGGDAAPAAVSGPGVGSAEPSADAADEADATEGGAEQASRGAAAQAPPVGRRWRAFAGGGAALLGLAAIAAGVAAWPRGDAAEAASEPSNSSKQTAPSGQAAATAESAGEDRTPTGSDPGGSALAVAGGDAASTESGAGARNNRATGSSSGPGSAERDRANGARRAAAGQGATSPRDSEASSKEAAAGADSGRAAPSDARRQERSTASGTVGDASQQPQAARPSGGRAERTSEQDSTQAEHRPEFGASGDDSEGEPPAKQDAAGVEKLPEITDQW